MKYDLWKAALSCNNDKGYEKPKTLHDTEEGPEWIKELSNIITPTEGTILSKYSLRAENWNLIILKL